MLFHLIIQTFHNVRRIAELLINLQQSGNVKYTGWILQLPCSKDERIIDTLQHQAKKMELELLGWKKVVNCARKEFYELNYYTTVQLLTLRRELSTEKGANSEIAPNVLFLLRSISHRVSSRGVRELVKNVLTPTTANPFSLKSMIQANNGDDISHQVKVEKLASSTAEDAPQPSNKPELTENELSNSKREILEFVTRNLNCSKLLVLKAFEPNGSELLEQLL